MVNLMPLVDEGLGNSAYLLDLGDGRALAVDPPRDLRALREAAARRGLRVAFAADTHLHADFLSGVRQLAADEGAQILASRAGRRAFGHRGLAGGDEVDLGGLTLRALATPGHTDEHLAFLILDGSAPAGAFTGGSLIVGSAARTDLLGAHRAEELAREQFRSLQGLAELPDETAVWPTHGAGSFCSAPAGAERVSTIGREKATNSLLAAPDADAFVAELSASLGSYPRYFERLAEVNRRGPQILPGEPVLAPLPVEHVRRLMGEGGVVVDVRQVRDVAAGRIPGSISIPLRAQFASWLGWLVADDVPVVIVRSPDQDPADVLWPALNIGYERLAGELAGGIDAWTDTRGSTWRTTLIEPGQIAGRVLDVRQRSEYESGHVPGAVHVELGELSEWARNQSAEVDVVMCGHGERAMSALSLLSRYGHGDTAVLVGSATDWSSVTGAELDTGA